MKNFMKLKVKTWELVVVCIILISVIMRPEWLVQLNQTLVGNVLLLVAVVIASIHKPYMGLLIVILIIALGFYREGVAPGAASSSLLTQIAMAKEKAKAQAADPASDNGGTTTASTESTPVNTQLQSWLKHAMKTISDKKFYANPAQQIQFNTEFSPLEKNCKTLLQIPLQVQSLAKMYSAQDAAARQKG